MCGVTIINFALTVFMGVVLGLYSYPSLHEVSSVNDAIYITSQVVVDWETKPLSGLYAIDRKSTRYNQCKDNNPDAVNVFELVWPGTKEGSWTGQ